MSAVLILMEGREFLKVLRELEELTEALHLAAFAKDRFSV
jgi:hypothetical protein